jgi:ABC-type sugar transport system ATPase subunit
LTSDSGAIQLRIGGATGAAIRWNGGVPATQASDVLLGVRPEHLHLRPTGKSGQHLPAQVDFVERVGARTIVHCLCADQSLKLVDDADCGAAVGDKVELHLTQDMLRLFDSSSGRALNASATLPTGAQNGAH